MGFETTTNVLIGGKRHIQAEAFRTWTYYAKFDGMANGDWILSLLKDLGAATDERDAAEEPSAIVIVLQNEVHGEVVSASTRFTIDVDHELPRA
jgi:hypothetical protein